MSRELAETLAFDLGLRGQRAEDLKESLGQLGDEVGWDVVLSIVGSFIETKEQVAYYERLCAQFEGLLNEEMSQAESSGHLSELEFQVAFENILKQMLPRAIEIQLLNSTGQLVNGLVVPRQIVKKFFVAGDNASTREQRLTITEAELGFDKDGTLVEWEYLRSLGYENQAAALDGRTKQVYFYNKDVFYRLAQALNNLSHKTSWLKR